MINAVLRLTFPRDARVIVIPAILNDDPCVDTKSFRPVQALRIGDILQDCGFAEQHASGDCFQLPPGIAWQFHLLELEALAGSAPLRIITLVRVGP